MANQAMGCRPSLGDTIVVSRTPDGGIHVEITCRRGDEPEVINAVHQLSQDCIDDTYGMYDKVRDSEAELHRMKREHNSSKKSKF